MSLKKIRIVVLMCSIKFWREEMKSYLLLLVLSTFVSYGGWPNRYGRTS
jgi:hypothetical protein